GGTAGSCVQPQVNTSRCGGLISTNSPAAPTPPRIPMREGPPRTRSRGAPLPIHWAEPPRAGKKGDTVSGGGAGCAPPLTTTSSAMGVLLPLLGFGQVLDPAQAAPPVVFDDGAQRTQGGLVGAVDAAGSLPALHHEPGLPQHAQVLADRRPGDVELRRDLA